MFEMGVSNTMIATRGLEEALVARSGPCPLPPDAWRRFAGTGTVLWYYDESIHLERAMRHGQCIPTNPAYYIPRLSDSIPRLPRQQPGLPNPGMPSGRCLRKSPRQRLLLEQFLAGLATQYIRSAWYLVVFCMAIFVFAPSRPNPAFPGHHVALRNSMPFCCHKYDPYYDPLMPPGS